MIEGITVKNFHEKYQSFETNLSVFLQTKYRTFRRETQSRIFVKIVKLLKKNNVLLKEGRLSFKFYGKQRVIVIRNKCN